MKIMKIMIILLYVYIEFVATLIFMRAIAIFLFMHILFFLSIVIGFIIFIYYKSEVQSISYFL